MQKNMLHSISHFDTILGLLAHKYVLTCAKILHYANTPTFGGTTAQVAKLAKTNFNFMTFAKYRVKIRSKHCFAFF